MARVRTLTWSLIGLSVVYWFALKRGWSPLGPWVLAVLVGLTLVLLALLLASHLMRLVRTPRARWRSLGAVLIVAGLLCLGGGGLANWLLGLQGWIILTETDAVPLFHGSHLEGFEAGPLADPGEMDLTLQLEELELVATEEAVRPRSRLRVLAGESGRVEKLLVRPGASQAVGSLRFHQGAFGFAPRIVILKEAETVFDEVVPFTTERRGPGGLTFEGRFNLRAEDLQVEGAVDLASLDEGLRGHATLRLEVRRGDRLLGRGALLPGHFATIEEGYRLGFAGLDKWSEIDVSRRNYGGFAVAGALLSLVGAVVWSVARWRGW